MLPDRVSNPGPLTYESDALQIALHGPAQEFACLLRVDPILGRLCPPGKHTGSHENCLPLKTWLKKDGDVSIHLI